MVILWYCSCYLSPENSTRVPGASSFFAHLLARIYLFSDCYSLYIAVDFNVRMGNLCDSLYGCDCTRLYCQSTWKKLKTLGNC